MKTSTLIAAFALSFAAAGSASAQDATDNVPLPAVSELSRAEVRADLAQARAAGSLDINEFQRNEPSAFASTRSRDAVRAEVRQALGSDGLRVLSGERAGLEAPVMARDGNPSAQQMAMATRK
jgi:hypothetical protein